LNRLEDRTTPVLIASQLFPPAPPPPPAAVSGEIVVVPPPGDVQAPPVNGIGGGETPGPIVTPPGDVGGGIVTPPGSPELPNKVLICHHTSSATNPVVMIEVSINAVPAHYNQGDVIGLTLDQAKLVLGADVNPDQLLPPGLTRAEMLAQCLAMENGDTGNGGDEQPLLPEKVLVCHRTSSAKNPYVMIEVSINAVKSHFDGHNDFIGFTDAQAALYAEQTGITIPADMRFTPSFDLRHDSDFCVEMAREMGLLDNVNPGHRTEHLSLSAVGSNSGGSPEIRVRDTETGEDVFRFNAFDNSFNGGTRVAVADVDRDGIPDIIVGAGPGGGPHIKVFSGATGDVMSGPLGSFFAFDSDFRGGVFVAAGDINGDRHADVMVSADEGGGPHVKVFDGVTGGLLFNSFVYDSSFRGGVRIAAGDVNGDGLADIITSAGTGGGPHIKVFSGEDGALLQNFMAASGSFRSGAFVASGDVDGDGLADIIVGEGAGGSPLVKVFRGTNLALINSFMAFAQDFRGGVSVGAADVDGDGISDIVTGAGPGGGPHVKVFRGTDLAVLASDFAFDPSFRGGVFVG